VSIAIPQLVRTSPVSSRYRWVDRPSTDIALAWIWLPIALAQRIIGADPGRATTVLGIAFLISFLHQPLTLGLVYGDANVMAARRKLYVIGPFVALGAVLLGLWVSLTVVAVIAGLWNAQHTLMQRYGLLRIYGRKAGDDHGSIEKPLMFALLGLAMVAVAADPRTPDLTKRVRLGQTNDRGVEIMQMFAPAARWALLPVVALVGWLIVRWVRAERAMGVRANRAKWNYMAATIGLIATICIDPLAGFTGYVAGHAIEYVFVVHRSLVQRGASGDVTAVGIAARTSQRRAGLWTVYVGAIAVFVWACRTYEWFNAYRLAVLVLGALHIGFDGTIWKLRRPAVAASVGAVTS
jgi:hypothetical protein